MLRNLFANRKKRFYSVENLVQKPVGEQDKTHEFSPGLASPILHHNMVSKADRSGHTGRAGQLSAVLTMGFDE